MSQALTEVNLAGLAAGQSFALDWSSASLPATSTSWENPPHLTIMNESGCGLLVTLPGSGRSFRLGAGAWTIGQGIELTPNDKKLTALVEYVIPNAPVTLLLATYWYPGEIVIETTLGNSPIGLSGSVSANIEQVIQDDKPAGTQVIEARPNGVGTSQVTLDNQGNEFLAGTLTVDGVTSLDTGAIVTSGAGDVTATGIVKAESLEFTGRAGFGGANPVITKSGQLVELWSPQSGAAAGWNVYSWDGASLRFPAAFGINPNGAGFFVSHGGALTEVAGIATAGPYGVPITTADPGEVNILNTALTTLASFTVPNDGKPHDIEASAWLFVGAGNTNNGVVTLQVTVTDPHEGALTLFYNVYGQANLINGIAQAKGVGIRTELRTAHCSANSVVTVSYRNTAAGTISDFAGAVIKLVG